MHTHMRALGSVTPNWVFFPRIQIGEILKGSNSWTDLLLRLASFPYWSQAWWIYRRPRDLGANHTPPTNQTTFFRSCSLHSIWTFSWGEGKYIFCALFSATFRCQFSFLLKPLHQHNVTAAAVGGRCRCDVMIVEQKLSWQQGVPRQWQGQQRHVREYIRESKWLPRF